MLVIDVRVITQDIEPQETMTNDNVPVKVRAVVWFRVVDSQKAIIEVASYDDAVRQTALTSLRNVIGQHSLDELLKEQDKLSQMLGKIIDDVIAANPKQLEQYRSGKTTVMNFFLGQVMKASRGQADPAAVTKLLKEKL